MHVEPVTPLAGEMIRALLALPRVKTPYISPEVDPTKVPCICGKYMPVSDCTVAWSGYTNYVVALCPDHLRDLAEYARVVCPRCRMLVALLKPHKEKTGFVVERGKVYHVEKCRFCDPESEKSGIVEKIVFYRARKIPYDVDNTIII